MPTPPHRRAALPLALCLAFATLLPGLRAADRAPARSRPEAWPDLESPSRLEAAYSPRRWIETVSDRGGLWGEASGPYEAWLWPFLLADGIEVRISTGDTPGFDDATPLGRLARAQIALPWAALLRATSDQAAIDVAFFAPRETPALGLLFRVESALATRIHVRLRPLLAPMHRPAAAELRRAPTPDDRGLALVDAARGTRLALVTSSESSAEARVLDGGDVEVELGLAPGSSEVVGLALSATWPGGHDADEACRRLLAALPAALEGSRRHYDRLLARAPMVTTPDETVSRALTWATVSLDQLRVRNPDLGLGIVSGFGPSRGDPRGSGPVPRYAWFFEEPMLTAHAYWRLGLDEHVRDAFGLLLRHQREDGKTVHEIVQSLRWWPRYFEEFPYAYLHSDGPVYYLAAFARHWRTTGDLELVHRHWPAMRRALEWCFGAVDEDDGLLRIAPGDWGSAESSFEPAKDAQLEAMWIVALRELAPLARALGEEDLARRCDDARERASSSTEEKLWSEELGAYRHALDRAGRPIDALVPHHALGVWLGAFGEERSRRQLEALARPEIRSDWGVRSLSLAAEGSDGAAYQSGSVWPVWNAGVLLGDFAHGRSESGFRNWRAMVEVRWLDQLGPMPEVLHGHWCQRLETGVPHQQFSELAIVNGLFDGLLGLDVDAPRRRIRWAPWLPPTWPALRVARVPAGAERVSLELERVPKEHALLVRCDAPSGWQLELAPRLPSGASIESATVDGAETKPRVERSSTATVPHVVLAGDGATHVLRLVHRHGVSFLPRDPPLRHGARSERLRLIRHALSRDELELVIAGRPAWRYEIDLFGERRILSVAGAEVADAAGEDRALLTTSAPEGASLDRAGFATWQLSVRFAPIARAAQ